MKEFFSGKGVFKIIATALLIVLILICSFFVLMDGIVNLITKFFTDFAVTVAETGVAIVQEYLEEVVLQISFDGDLKFYVINEQAVEDLKASLESVGINTDVAGLTEVRLKKILLTQAVSTSFSSTLCMATVTEEEILLNVKEKERYKDITSLNEFLDDPESIGSSADWPGDFPEYDLYYDSEKFFYFKDTEDAFGGGSDQWYLAAMGVIDLINRISEEAAGARMVWGTEESFQRQREDFEEAKETWIARDDEFAEEELESIYTDGDTPYQIKVWKIKTFQRMYDYTFENPNIETIEKKGKDEERTYIIEEEIVDLEEAVDLSSYAISIELMIDLLDMTSSGDYLETFMDYALSRLSVKVNLYQTEEVRITYDMEEFNIPRDFVLEVYDFINLYGNAGDAGNDNFRAYADIVYNRMYEGSYVESVAELLRTHGTINYDGRNKEQITINAEYIKARLEAILGDFGELIAEILEFLDDFTEKSAFLEKAKDILGDIIANNSDTIADILGVSAGAVEDIIDGLLGALFDGEGYTYWTQYNVPALEDCLKSAYDPEGAFSLGEITVKEKTRERRYETSCEAALARVETWYEEVEYSDPTIEKQYSLSVNGFPEVDITEEEYIDFGYDDLETYTVAADRTREVIQISEPLVDQYPSVSGYEIEDNRIDGNMDVIDDETNYRLVQIYTILSGGTDLTDEILDIKPGKNNKKHYNSWTSRGLFLIGTVDGGDFNDPIGAGQGSDYVYAKYTRTNRKIYDEATKIEKEVLNTSNVVRTSIGAEDRLKQFLAFLKNADGIIPTTDQVLTGQVSFDSNGKVVKYEDIYDGYAPAGDFLLDNGALMLFEVLESNQATQGLVNVFKYLAYLYTGVDYGITDAAQLDYLFSTGQYTGTDFIVNTGMSTNDIVLDRDKLKEVIEQTYSGQTRANLLSCIDDFMYIQETNKVNAVFAIAVTIIESSGGTNWSAIAPHTHNWMSVTGSYNGNSYQNPDSPNPRTWRVYPSFNIATRDFGDLIANGSYYFQAGKYSVRDIAPTYCNEDWGVSIVSEMSKMYNEIGINTNTGGTEGTSGSVTTFTVGNKTYKNYKQIEESYKNIPLAGYPSTNLYYSGCAVTSVAIIASAYDSSVDPIAVNNYERSIGGAHHIPALKHYTGLDYEWIYSGIKNGVINQLRQGYPVMVYVGANSGTFATSRGHFFVILSVSEDGNSIYVSNPSTRRTGTKNGWISASVLNESAFQRYLKVK